MIINEFIPENFSLPDIEKAIKGIDFKDKDFWRKFSWGFYENSIFILYEHNSVYGNLVRQIAYLEENTIYFDDCSNGETDSTVKKILNFECKDKYLTKYAIENIFNNQLER